MNRKLNRDLRWSRRLSFVPRWGVVPTLRRQSVAEHVFHTTRTALWLLEHHTLGHDPAFRLQVLEQALRHDDAEAASGDIPSPYKTGTGKETTVPAGLSAVDVVVKCADLLEALAFIEEERKMGNMHGMNSIVLNITTRFGKYWDLFSAPSFITHMDIIDRYLRQIVPDDRHYEHPVLENHDL